jgi:DNA-binding LytR/AlgR family response regulator
MMGPVNGPDGQGALRVLVVDDEEPARNELAFLLGDDDRIGSVATAADGAEALRRLEQEPVDAVFLDIRMPGLDGLDLAKVLRRFAAPPAVVFVTAYDDHAVTAFDLRAVDYLLKPVRTDRLRDAVDRVLESRRGADAVEDPTAPPVAPAEEAPPADETIAVELGGVTRFVRRSDVRYVEAHGDYARLVTADGRHLVRVPLSVLEERWAAAGFVRIHRRWLVALGAIDEVRIDGGRMSVRVDDTVLEVSRRHTRELRDRLVRSARPGR